MSCTRQNKEVMARTIFDANILSRVCLTVIDGAKAGGTALAPPEGGIEPAPEKKWQNHFPSSRYHTPYT